MSLEPNVLFMLAAVPGEIAGPLGLAAAGALTKLYRDQQTDKAHAREDTRDAITAIKDNQAANRELVQLVKDLADAVRESRKSA